MRRCRCVRAGAPRGSRHAVLLVAEALDGLAARTAVLAAPVEVAADPSLLPRWQKPLLALGLMLLALALGYEARRVSGRASEAREATAGPLVGDATKLRLFAASLDNLLAMSLALLAASRLPDLPDPGRQSVAVVVYLAYFLVQEGAWSNTVGKHLFGLCVRRLSGSACGWNAAVIRTVARILEANPILLGGLPAALAGAFSRRHQRFGDMLSGCVVTRRTSRGPADVSVQEGDEGPRGRTVARVLAFRRPDLTPIPTATYGVDGMEKPKDYYQLLGVPRDASLTAIKRAFKRLARRFDPGRVQEATDAIAELQAAYETLSDAERRRSYDDELGGADRWAPVDWSFVRRPAAGDLRRPFAPTSLAAEILLKADEMAGGTVVSIDVPVTATCDACGGTGGSVFDCDRCQGEGKVARRLPVPVHVPAGLRDGAVFQRDRRPGVPSILLTVHQRRV